MYNIDVTIIYNIIVTVMYTIHVTVMALSIHTLIVCSYFMLERLFTGCNR